MSAVKKKKKVLYSFLLFCRVLRYSGREPMVEPVCEPALARQADVSHLQQRARQGRAWAPAPQDADALCQSHVPAHLPLREHRGVQTLSDDGPRGGSRYCEWLFHPWAAFNLDGNLRNSLENSFYLSIHSRNVYGLPTMCQKQS